MKNGQLIKWFAGLATLVIVAAAGWVWRTEGRMTEMQAHLNQHETFELFHKAAWRMLEAGYDDVNEIRQHLDMPVEKWTDHLVHGGIRE